MKGILLAIAAYTIWGGFPLFFHYLSHIQPAEVLSHRIIWALIGTLLIGLVMGRWKNLIALTRQPKLMFWLGVSGVLISANWFIYIWAVGQQQVIEASLGYFISPVLSLILARLVLKEPVHYLQAIAGLLALIAVIWEIISLGRLPWIGLSLATLFALYGLIRKYYPVDALNGLIIETAWLLLPTLIWLGWQSYTYSGSLAFSQSPTNTVLLIMAGLLTALPLLLFAMAARRSHLSVVGFIMYINPTIQFLTGLYILKEPYPSERMVTFIVVWIGLLLFMIGLWQQHRNQPKT